MNIQTAYRIVLEGDDLKGLGFRQPKQPKEQP